MTERGIPPTQSTHLGRGICLVLIANLLFSIVDASTKWLIGAGLVVAQLAFMRYGIHFVIAALERGARRRPMFDIPPRLRWLVFARSFFLVTATLANFVALGQLPLSVTAALLFLSPIFVFFFAALILGEKIRSHNWVAAVLGLIGTLLILWPFGQPINWYAVLMLYPASGLALYQVLSRMLAGQVRPGVLQVSTGALGTVVLAPLAWVMWQAPQTALEWSLLVGIGAFAWLGHEALTRAHADAPASTLAPFGYSFVLFLTVNGWLVFGEIPALNALAGATAIVSGGLFVWWREQRVTSAA